MHISQTDNNVIMPLSLRLTLGAADLSSSFLQQFDWVLYKAKAAWPGYSL